MRHLKTLGVGPSVNNIQLNKFIELTLIKTGIETSIWTKSNYSAPTRSGIIFYANFRKSTTNYPIIIVVYILNKRIYDLIHGHLRSSKANIKGY